MQQLASIWLGNPTGGITGTTPGTDHLAPPATRRTSDPPPPPPKTLPKRFHGTVTLDAERVGRDAGNIAAGVIAHLAGLVGSKVKVTLEIEAEVPAGAPDHVVRTVTKTAER